jgi:hypothetical protein
MLKWLHGTVCRKRPELLPSVWILHHENAPAHKVLFFKQFVPQKSIIEMEHPHYSSDMAPSDFWLFLKVKFAIKC